MTQTSATPEASADQPPEHGTRRVSAADRWRPLLLRWHFYAGILIGPFLLVAAITGTAYALIPQIDRAVYSHELTVDKVGTTPLPLSEQVAAARKAHPEGTIVSVTPAPQPSDTTRVIIAADDVPAERNRTVFVDPYSGEVRGALNTYGEWLPVRDWFDEMHRTLHLGEIGRNYSEIGASWLWVVALGGLVLWIGYRRRTRKARRLLVPDRNAPKRQRRLSWHGAVGTWIIIGLIGLSASGLSWSRFAGENIGELRTTMSWTTPAVSTDAPEGVEQPPAEAQTVDGFTRVYETAQNAGLVGPMQISAPSVQGAAWKVKENGRGFPSEYDAISVDPTTFAVKDRVDFAQWPIAAKLTNWAISAHMGLFGVVNQIILVLLGIGLISVILRGYRMWWKRRPSSGGLPAAPGRGALGSLLPIEAVIVVAVAFGVGWFIPWFGAPLGLFVLIDVVRGYLAKRRAPESGSETAGATESQGAAQ